jgi:regulator of sirC expression with transglutaminase-like and TPR domain
LLPENDTVINTRVRFYSSLGKWDKALTDVNKCIEINPKNSEYFSTRGAIYVQLKDTEKGMADLNKAIEAGS